MEIQEFVKKTELVPLAELTTLAATRGRFGDDVLAGLHDADRTAQTAAQTVLDAASRRTATPCSPRAAAAMTARCASATRFSACVRNVEQRTEQRAFVPESQRQQPKKRSGPAHSGSSCAT